MTVLASARAGAHLALFSAEPFHLLGLAPGERYLRVDHHDAGGTLVASLCGQLDDAGGFVSGASAPFGGVDLVDPLAPVLPTGLVDGLIDGLRAAGVVHAEVRARPAGHGPGAAALEAALLDAGFTAAAVAVNQHVDLTAYADADAYLAALPKKRRWALRQDLAAGYRLHDADDGAHGGWSTVHAVIDRARTVKGRPRWLAPAYLRDLRAAFPGRVDGLLMTLEGDPVAAAVVYRAVPGVDLLAAWGDTASTPRSPMNLLALRLVERSLAGGARVLDLGISSEPDGTPNAGLIHFKRSVGATEGTRPTLVKDLT